MHDKGTESNHRLTEKNKNKASACKDTMLQSSSRCNQNDSVTILKVFINCSNPPNIIRTEVSEQKTILPDFLEAHIAITKGIGRSCFICFAKSYYIPLKLCTTFLKHPV